MGKVPGGDEVLKTSWMTKRSQLKSRFSFTNYKDRWFVLTRTHVLYYDGADNLKKKEKGRIALRDVKLVERVSLRDETAKPHAFQIGYRDGSGRTANHRNEYSLYIQAKSEAERDEWIQLLRNLCRHNPTLSEKYHPSQWSAGRWMCCGNAARGAAGCWWSMAGHRCGAPCWVATWALRRRATAGRVW